MEGKIVKTPVYAYESIFRECAEQPVDVDFTLPDYCPEISRILKCRATAQISSKNAAARTVTVEGNVTINVLYCDIENRLCAYEYQYPFSRKFQTDEDTDGGRLVCDVRCEYINCRAVTGRKIDIHGAVSICVNVKKRKATEVVSDVDDETVELKRSAAPATTTMAYTEKYMLIEEEVEIGDGQPPVRTLLRYNASTVIRESKLISGKIIVKGELVLTLLYCSENGAPQTVRSTIPFSQLLEVEGTNDQCECKVSAEPAFIELKSRTGSTGEVRSFQLAAKLLVCCECTCDNEVAVLLDAYSKKYTADITRKDVTFGKICRNINETFHCKKSLDFPTDSLSSVVDIWCDTECTDTKANDGEIIINGNVTVHLLATDNSDVPNYFEKEIPFEYRVPVGDMSSSVRCEPKISVTSCDYTITSSEKMELRVDLNMYAAVCEFKDMSLISEFILDEKNLISKKDRGAMVVCFAQKGENLWEIARHYVASVGEIRRINEIPDDVELLSDDKMLLVPVS